MAGKHVGQHEISTVGVTTTQAITGTHATFQLVNPTATTLPAHFILFTDTDCYLRQGGTTAAEASTSDFLLKKNTYRKITVHDQASSYISVERVSANGTLRATRDNSVTPGTGTSGAA